MPDSPTAPPIKIYYQALPGTREKIWPLVDIRLTNANNVPVQPFSALVDSGANISILHPEVAEILGFHKHDLQYRKGGKSVSGEYASALTPDPVNVSIYGYPFSLKFAVVDNPVLAFACILGQDSIFKWARLDFQGFKNFFEIKFRRDLN